MKVLSLIDYDADTGTMKTNPEKDRTSITIYHLINGNGIIVIKIVGRKI